MKQLIPKPRDPLTGLIPSPARKWRKKDEWINQPVETPVRSAMAERGPIYDAMMDVFRKSGVKGVK